MRLSQWQTRAPVKDSVTPKVVAVVGSALVTLGAEADPECWIVWGDDPALRYLIFVPIASGLIQANVRVMVPGEGPRASAKIIRWNRVQLGELSVEIQGGHRLVAFQAEAQVLSGVDGVADDIAAFARALFDAVDGRAGSFAVPPAGSERVAKPTPAKAPAARSSPASKPVPAKRTAAKGS